MKGPKVPLKVGVFAPVIDGVTADPEWMVNDSNLREPW